MTAPQHLRLKKIQIMMNICSMEARYCSSLMTAPQHLRLKKIQIMMNICSMEARYCSSAVLSNVSNQTVNNL
jgi:hypothetical protein